MKILLLGKNGQVGWELHRALPQLGEIVAFDFPDIDYARPLTLRPLIRTVKPDIVVNAVAFTAVEKAEVEEKKARLVNATAPSVLAEETERLGSLLVHYSTEYVFDGKKPKPYAEDDAPNPLTVYGQTKLAGDQAVVQGCSRHFIFRTAWMYGARGQNYMRTMLSLTRENKTIRIVKDQVGAPTWAKGVAQGTAFVLAKLPLIRNSAKVYGIYNMAASGETTWMGFAEALFREASKENLCVKPELKPILSSEYPGAVQRPLNSLLSGSKLHETFGIRLPDWEETLPLVIAELAGTVSPSPVTMKHTLSARRNNHAE
jgi:dTDP-4-dehydrorhamnose reductase